MARHIDNPDLTSIRQGQPTEAKIDRHLAGLFFLEAIRMRAGEGLDQCRFAVVYMTSGAYHANAGLDSSLFLRLLPAHAAKGYR